MKIALLILFACVGVMAMVGMPAGWERVNEAPAEAETARAGTPLACDVQSSRPCHLRVDPGPETVVDRGPVRSLSAHHDLYGTFRYVQEQAHRMLYVYDDVQNLSCRVVDPAAVTLVDLTP